MIARVKEHKWIYLLQTMFICFGVYGGISSGLAGEWSRVAWVIFAITMTIFSSNMLKRNLPLDD